MHDGYLSVNNGNDQTDEEAQSSRLLTSLLEHTTADRKVIIGALRGIFDLDRAAVENFFHIVDQRVNEQNGCTASTCEIGIYYNDGTSRKFPSISSFQQYSETRNRFPTVITLHLGYFIHFPSEALPEKQEIDITIRSSETISDTIDLVQTDSSLRASGNHVHMHIGHDNSQFGIITYEINHSRVTWGLDLEGHIRSQIEALMTNPSVADKLISKVSGPLNLFTTIFVGLYIANLIIDAFFWFLYRTDSLTEDRPDIAVAAEYLVNGHIAKYIVASLVVSVVSFTIFSGIISRIINSIKKPRPSFIVLNSNDKKWRDQKIKGYEKRWTRITWLLLLNASVGFMIFFLEERLFSLLI